MMQVAILENLQREDLTSLEEAEAYNMMMEKLSMTQEKVAEKLGKSRSYIANHLRLLTLPNEVKDLLQENQLSNGQARTLLGLKDKKKLTKLARRTGGHAADSPSLLDLWLPSIQQFISLVAIYHA